MKKEKGKDHNAGIVRESVASYAVKKSVSGDVGRWRYDPRKLIPLNQIQEVAKRIAERYVVEKILLFGSYAYGTPEEGSDVDLLVIMNHDKPSNRKQRLEICGALYPKPFPIDILVRTPRDVEVRIAQGDWLLKDAWTKGKALYDRA